MKANFHLITETEEEVLACTAFIEGILKKRKAQQVSPKPIGSTVYGPVSDTSVKVFEAASGSKAHVVPDDDDEVPMSAPVKPHVPRPNVSPGEPGISKIGERAKEECMVIAHSGSSVPHSLTEHMKLLWKRGEVKFDGEEYYV